MRDHASSRGTAALTAPPPIDVDLLWHRFTVKVADGDARHALRMVRLGAIQDLRPEVTCEIEVLGAPGDYLIYDNGDLAAQVGQPNEIAGAVLERMQRRAFELAALKGWLRIHGAVLSVDGRRLAVVGPSGAGKTTLTVAALAAGHPVEADESFLFADGTAIAVPRRLHVEHGTFSLVPEGRQWALNAPMLSDDPPVVALDPSELGYRWRTRAEPLDAVVLIGVGGDSHIRTLATPEALPLILGQALPTIETRATVTRQVAALLRTTPVHAIGGGHRASPEALLRILATAPASR